MARTSDPHAATVKAWETRRRKDESEGLGAWTPEGKWIPNDSDAMRSWGAGKVTPGDVPVPYPVWTEDEQAFDLLMGKGHWRGKRPINKDEPVARAKRVGLMRVPVKDLIATQHVVTERTVANNVRRLKDADNKPWGIPVIVRYNGKSYIYDGHHRASAAKVMGASDLEAMVFDVPSPGVMLTGARY